MRNTLINSYETNTGKDIGSENYSYTTKSSTEHAKSNKIAYAASGGGYTDNIVQNRAWKFSSSSITYDTSQSYFGASSLKAQVVSGSEQIFAIQTLSGFSTGTYTISAYVKTSDVTGSGGAYMDFSFTTPSGRKVNCSDLVTGTTNTEMEDGWTRITITVDVPSDVTGASVAVGLVNVNGTAWFDGIQVEKG